ncbi:jg12203, partial [Pararge aegeria aegeria]
RNEHALNIGILEGDPNTKSLFLDPAASCDSFDRSTSSGVYRRRLYKEASPFQHLGNPTTIGTQAM